MTLLEAFREIGPAIGSESVRARRQDAATILLDECSRLQRRIFGDDDLGEDAVMITMANLIRTGPRGVRAADPDTDEGVRAFLIKSLRNSHRLASRSRKRWHFDGEELPPEIAAADVEEQRKRAWAAEQMAWAEMELLQVIAPAVAARLNAAVAEQFTNDLAAFVRVIRGEQSLDEATMAALGSVSAKHRSTMRTRFGRVKLRLHTEIGRADYTNVQRLALYVALQTLALRKKEPVQS